MNVSSRTPGGHPLRCEICGDIIAVEVADAGDAICPSCGSLLWEFRSHLAQSLNVPVDEIGLGEFPEWMVQDSLDVAEMIMFLEELWGHRIDESDLAGIESVQDLIALIRGRQRGQDDGDAE